MLFYLLGVVQSIRDLGFPISAINGPNGCKEQMGWPRPVVCGLGIRKLNPIEKPHDKHYTWL